MKRDASSNSLVCLKTELPKPTQLLSIPSLEVSSTGEDWFITREGTRCWHKLTNFVTNSHSSHLLFKGSFILPKYHSPSLKTSKMLIFKRPMKTIRWSLFLKLTRTFHCNLNTYSVSSTPRASRFITSGHQFLNVKPHLKYFGNGQGSEENEFLWQREKAVFSLQNGNPMPSMEWRCEV